MSYSQNKLGEMPIGRLMISMSVPMMISMFVQALYNIIDSVFVAKLCEEALTAVALSFPVQNAMTAFGVGTGVGISAMISRALGAGDSSRACKAANVQIFLDLFFSIMFAFLSLLFARNFFAWQTDVASIIGYGTQYLRIVCICSAGNFFAQGFEKLLIATGNAASAMISQTVGAVLNIILDPILIFGLGPIPALGIRGAAVATVLGQLASAVCAFCLCLKYAAPLRFDLRQMLPTLRLLKDVYSIGLAAMITLGLDSIMGYGMNWIFLSFSTTAATVFGIWLRLQNFAFMPVFGMNSGNLAIYSYNRGAGRIDRVFATMRLAITVGFCITASVTVLYECIPIPLLRLFNASDYMMGIGVTALRTCAISLSFGAISIMISAACQLLGHPDFMLVINFGRQAVFQICAAWLLSHFGRLELVWFAPLIAELLAITLAVLCCRTVIRELKQEANKSVLEQ